jgi:hypothetical protein
MNRVRQIIRDQRFLKIHQLDTVDHPYLDDDRDIVWMGRVQNEVKYSASISGRVRLSLSKP